MKCGGGCLKTVLILLCLSADVVNSSPVSPCPQVFNYRFDGVEWYGVISVPSPQQYGSSIKLNVHMSIPVSLPNNNAGRIELVGPRAEVVQAALYGRNIQYNVRFPLPSVIPTITGIILNDNIICSGPPVTGPVVTSLKLQHTLFPDNRRQNTIPSTSRPSSNVQIYEYDFGSHSVEDPNIQIFDEYGNQITNSGQQYSSFNNQNQPYNYQGNNRPNEWSYSNQPNSNNYWNTQNKPYDNNGQQYYPSQYNPTQNNAYQTTNPSSFNPTQNTNTQYYNPSQYNPSSQNTGITSRPNNNNYNPSQYNPSYNQNIGVTSRPNNNYQEQTHQTRYPYYNPTTTKRVPSRVTQSYKPTTQRTPQNTSQRRKPGNVNSVAPVASSQPVNPPVINFNQQFNNNSPKPVVATSLPSGSFREQYSDVCGVSSVGNPLIANGQTTIKGEFPWLAALFTQKTLGLEFRCSASLITNRHVVTAAHCIKYGDNPTLKEREILIILGKYNIRRWTEKGTLILEVEQIHLHPNYGSLGFDADLAVLSFIRNVEFNTQVRPICMWDEPEDLLRVVGQFATVVGWGRDEKGQRITDEPKLARIPIVSQEDCLRSKEEFRHYTSNRTLCAGLRNGTGPCNGDSGGALLLHRNNRWFIRGVVSLSLIDPTTRSCDLSQYTVFTDIAKYKDWLVQFYF